MINVSSFSKRKQRDYLSDNEQKNFDKIYQEYSLKRNNFNPKDKSPNKFVKKLQLRMRLYYDQLR